MKKEALKREGSNSVKITAIITGALVILSFLIVGAVFDDVDKTVQVSGESQIDVVPDKVSIVFNVETKGDTAKIAKDENSRITDKVTLNLINMDYEVEDIQTSGFNIWEEFDWTEKGRIPLGFKASHQIKVIVKSHDLIGETIDAGVDGGANIGYINFELSKELENQYKAQAIKLATQDAKSKAEAMAQGLNMKLDDIVSVSNSEFNYYPWVAYDTASLAAEGAAIKGESLETRITPSEQSVSARVSVVYEIK